MRDTELSDKVTGLSIQACQPSIMVGTDFSATADQALAQALEMAEDLRLSVDLVHVVHHSRFNAKDEVRHVIDEESQLERLRDYIRTYINDRVPLRTHLRAGDPAGELLQAAADLHPLMVVVGSQGRGTMARMAHAFRGSVTSRLVQRSPVPLMVVPAPLQAGAEPPHGLVSEERQAFSCFCCGHIRGWAESGEFCHRCGLYPTRWNTARITAAPADALEPAVGTDVGESHLSGHTGEAMDPFPTSPMGIGGYDVNPELRVRY
jgi:nucleotide-binding universal stress UspA family protein